METVVAVKNVNLTKIVVQQTAPAPGLPLRRSARELPTRVPKEPQAMLREAMMCARMNLGDYCENRSFALDRSYKKSEGFDFD